MSRSSVALLIVLTAILGYFSMVGVAIFSRGVPGNNFRTPESDRMTPASETMRSPAAFPTIVPSEKAE